MYVVSNLFCTTRVAGEKAGNLACGRSHTLSICRCIRRWDEYGNSIASQIRDVIIASQIRDAMGFCTNHIMMSGGNKQRKCKLFIAIYKLDPWPHHEGSSNLYVQIIRILSNHN